MGNLFLGFPVPRAKIASMIEGTAPPSIHATQHEIGGTDVLDGAKIPGAGGISLPLRDFWQDFRHMDTNLFYHAYTGSGSLVRSYQKLTLATGSTNPSSALLSHNCVYPITTLTWAKKRNILTNIEYYLEDNVTGNIHFFSGKKGNYNHIGFEFKNSKLYGINGASSGSTNTELATYSAGGASDIITLEAIYFPGEKVEFWVNGELLGTSITNLPSGTADANRCWDLKCDNGSTTNEVTTMFNHFQIYQEA